MGQCKICKTNGITMLWDDTCGFCLQKECEALRASMGRVYCVKRMAVLKTLLLEVKGYATLTLEQLDRIDAALDGEEAKEKSATLLAEEECEKALTLIAATKCVALCGSRDGELCASCVAKAALAKKEQR